MDKIFKGKIVKKVVCIMLVLIMLCGYVPMQSNAQTEETEEFVTFNVLPVRTHIESKQVHKGLLKCNFTLTGVQTGFKNVVVTMYNLEDGTLNAKMSVPKVNSSTTKTEKEVIETEKVVQINYGDLRTGTQIQEDIDIEFGEDPYYKKYDKTIRFTIEGEYINPKTRAVENLYIEKDVTFSVYPKDQTSYFKPSLEIQEISNEAIDIRALRNNKEEQCGYYIKHGIQSFYIKIYTKEYTYEDKLKLTINKNNTSDWFKAMVIDYNSFIEQGYILEDINGDEIADSNGEVYKKGIDGIETEDNKIALTKNLGDGDLTLTFRRVAKTEKIEDAYREIGFWTDGYSWVEGAYPYVLSLEYYTNLEEGCENTLGEGRKGLPFNLYGELEVSGWNYIVDSNIEKEKIDVTQELVSKTFNVNGNYGPIIYEYFPGDMPWAEITHPVPNKYDIYTDDHINNGYFNLEDIYKIRYHVSEGFIFETPVETDGWVTISNLTLFYIGDDGEYKELDVSDGTVSISNISAGYNRGLPDTNIDDLEGISKLNDNAKITIYNGEDIVGEIDKNNPEVIFEPGVTSVKMVFNDWQNVGYKGYEGFSIKYNVSIEKLKEKGLSDNEIKEITNIMVSVGTNNFCSVMHPTSAGSRSNIEYVPYSYQSYMEVGPLYGFSISYGDLNEKKKSSVCIQMKKPEEQNFDSAYNFIVNENPTFYIKLSEDYRYSNKYKVDIRYADPDYYKYNVNCLRLRNVTQVQIKGEKYLLVQCEGTYNSKIHPDIDIIVNMEQRLVNASAKADRLLEVYMLTNNENYRIPTKNTEELFRYQSIPEEYTKQVVNYQIKESGMLQNFTDVIKNDKIGIITYRSNMTDETDAAIEKNCPVAFTAGGTVKYSGILHNALFDLNNINVLFRLPVANNTEIKDLSSKLIEDGFILPEEYVNTHTAVTNISAEEPVKQVSLEDLRNIKVLVNNKEIDKSNYKIYFTNEYNTGFELTSDYIEYVEGTSDVSDAKSILVKLNEDYVLKTGEKLELQYDMTMPTDEEKYGMVGAMYGVLYTEEKTGLETRVDSEAAYIIKGDLAKVEIQKIFEGFEAGEAPEGVSLKGIEFKLTDEYGVEYVKDYYDNDNDGDTDEDLVLVTDENGRCTINRLDQGTYGLEEITQFEDYDRMEYTIIDAVDGNLSKVEALNKLKTGTLKIQKTFEDTNEISALARFIVTRISNDNLEYQTYVLTDEEGNAVLEGLPYGKYRIEEGSTIEGYGRPKSVEVEINGENPIVEVPIENPLGKGKIVINKTVPMGESIEGIKFQITGKGLISYTNKQGEFINNNTDLLLTIGADYSADPNVNIEISEDKLSAVITLENLPLGLYTIEEVEIPNLEGQDIPKYVKVKRNARLLTDGAEEKINIRNQRKIGYLQIQKSAYVQAGEERQEIGDLSMFKVRITGQSYYGSEVDRVVNLDENGYALTAIEIGTYTVKEVPVDGYDVYYINGDGNAINSDKGVQVEIKYDETANTSVISKLPIENILTGTGYVRVEKTLEGVTDPQKVIDAGIKFKVVGKNPAGARVEETILIDKIDSSKNVAYGISNAIVVGGEYQLEEDDTTIPEYYEGMEPRPIQVGTTNTEENPLVINVENVRTKGNLEIITETEPAGGILTGITYRVTQVEINADGTYTKLDGSTESSEDTTVELAGDNGSVNTSFAELRDIKSGNYLVEQLTVPTGYEKDLPQIVEVPSYGIGYAVFTIKKDDVNQQTKLVINKEILNNNGEIATSSDFTNAKLDENETFEVKVTNVDTKQVYYTFISSAQNGILTGLEPGVYEVEEQYKPKYITEGYYRNGENDELQQIETSENGKYIVEVTENETSEITIKNRINTDFPFGGQDLKDNYSKIDVEEQEILTTTKTVIYVVDEEGNEIPGATFKLLDSEGNRVILGTVGTEFTTVNKKLIIKGLPEGDYTLVNTSVPSGYLQPADKKVTVYKDVVRVARIEIQKNIPRGALTLSTTYVTADNETKYVPRSKYKVVNTATGELVKFTKTATGDYIKSNLDDASTVITLKSGAVDIKGIETGTYEIGLVDVTSGYGMKTDLPETVVVETNQVKNVNVEVVKKKIVQVEGGYYNTMYLDESGQLWIMGANESGVYANGIESYSFNEIPTKINLPENVFITQFDMYEMVVAIDSNGKVWTWGNAGSYGSADLTLGDATIESSLQPICITDIEGNSLNEAYKNGVRIKETMVGDAACVLLDTDGKVWTWGNNSHGQLGTETIENSSEPICITDIEGNTLCDAYNNGIKIVELLEYSGYSETFGGIDSLGRIWVWGTNVSGKLGTGNLDDVYTPICISELYPDLVSAYIIDLSISNTCSVAVDKDGNAWVWGDNGCGQLGIGTTEDSLVPVKISSESFEGAKIVQAIAGPQMIYFIDEYGKLWGAGTECYLGIGSQSYTNVTTPICVSSNSKLVDYKVTDISIDVQSLGTVCLDNENGIWGWSTNVYMGQYGNNIGSVYSAEKIDIDYTEHLEYNLKFVEIVKGRNSSIAIDGDGNLWGIGEKTEFGYASSNNNYTAKNTNEFIQISGFENEKIIHVCAMENRNGYIALSETGNVYVFGRYLDNGQAGIDTYFGIVDVTANFGLEDGIKIVSVTASIDGSCVAVDTLGRVWTWGNNDHGGLGIGTTDYDKHQTPTCISDQPTEPLFNVRIKAVYGNNGIHAIDEEGRIWYWGDSGSYTGINNYNYITTPMCITDIQESELGKAYSNGTRFELITESGTYNNICALDTERNVWVLYGNIGHNGISAGYSGVYCINNVEGHKINEQAQKYEDYKIEKINSIYGIGLAITDNQGTTWLISNDTAKIQDKYNVPTDITDIALEYLIDGYGQIWKWSSTGSECLAGTIKNELYGMKFKQIIEDGLVEADTDKGEIYKVDAQGSSFVMYSEAYIEKYLGKQLVYLDKKVTKSYKDSSIIAIDEDGKLWMWGGANADIKSEVPVCISNIEGSELAEAHKNDSNFKLEKIVGKSLALDNYGRVWYSGYYKIDGKEQKTNSFICINNVSGTEFYNACQADENLKIKDIQIFDGSYVLTDTNSDTWVFENNYYGQLGNGTTSSNELYCISKALGIKIKKIGMYKTEYSVSTIILDTEGNIWTCGGPDSSTYAQNYYYGITGSATMKTTPTKILETMTGITDFYATGECVFAYGENAVWAWGRNDYGQLGLGYQTGGTAYYIPLKNKLVYVPQKISSEFTIEKISQYYYTTYAIDTTGKVWTWGQSGDSATPYIKPTCISDDATEGLYGIQMQEILCHLTSGDYLKDVDGNIYSLKGSASAIEVNKVLNVNEVVEKIFGEVTTENIINVLNCPKIINGRVWNIAINQTDWTISAELVNANKGELVGKTIVQNTVVMAIDSEGNLYGWSGYDGIYSETPGEPICINSREISKQANIKFNNTLLNVPVINKLNGIKIAEILNDQIVKDVNGNYWFFPENGQVINITEKAKQDSTLSFEIAEVIDNTHIKSTEDVIYAISNDGKFTKLATYEPAEAPEYSEVTIEGVNIVDYSQYKALDENGNLYVWGMYTGGYSSGIETSEQAICTTTSEYIVEPIYSQTNGWSVVKGVY